jgi:hypothetical protein
VIEWLESVLVFDGVRVARCYDGSPAGMVGGPEFNKRDDTLSNKVNYAVSNGAG